VNLTESELDVIHELVNANLEMYDVLDQMPDPVRSVTPAIRIPGARPAREEDPLNAIVRYVDVKATDVKSGPLSGKKIGIKDTVCVAGIPTTCASKLLYDYTPDVDATVVKRILEAGDTLRLCSTLTISHFPAPAIPAHTVQDLIQPTPNMLPAALLAAPQVRSRPEW
jgi:Asp-tRNA(Asn)/Glu-tRNA(Gln) amidotransferase A subunit family amidase